ncbi:hypothetical protein [Pararhodobacter zhoushanensis]|uniref:Bacteriophage lambda head decoration protein D n=1 Tax=Pararhodobacter zhoushanensis TaxID=2479545 RepID=A0ABT3H2Q9_9RHOB|nr:hypothetical protein [Pararhodobacter zhoushanensis]MCW1934115.1 hypothetical protein [Pararhodobacter zhoushanensis]
MVALTSDRNTQQAAGDLRTGNVAASQLIYAGALVMRNAAGTLVKASTATGLIGVGRAEERVDNASGDAGDKQLRYRPGIYRFANSASGDLITAADIGAVCYAVDDQTVAKTHATNTRSPAGVVDDVDDLGVWVRVDAALTKAALS